MLDGPHVEDTRFTLWLELKFCDPRVLAPDLAGLPTARAARDTDGGRALTPAEHDDADTHLRQHGIDPDGPRDPQAWERAAEQVNAEARALCAERDRQAAPYLDTIPHPTPAGG